jgi:hypothetical protein
MGPYAPLPNTAIRTDSTFDRSPLGQRAMAQRSRFAQPRPETASFYGDTSVGRTPGAQGTPAAMGSSLTPWQMSQYTRGQMGPAGLSAAIGHPANPHLAGLSSAPGQWAALPEHDPGQQSIAQAHSHFQAMAAAPVSDFGARPGMGDLESPHMAALRQQGQRGLPRPALAARPIGAQPSPLKPDPNRVGPMAAPPPTPHVDALRARLAAQPWGLRRGGPALPQDPHLTPANVSPFRARQIVGARMQARPPQPGLQMPGGDPIAALHPEDPFGPHAMAERQRMQSANARGLPGFNMAMEDHQGHMEMDQEGRMREARIAQLQGQNKLTPEQQMMASFLMNQFPAAEAKDNTRAVMEFGNQHPHVGLMGPMAAATPGLQGSPTMDEEHAMDALFAGGDLGGAHSQLMALHPDAANPGSPHAANWAAAARRSLPDLAAQLQAGNSGLSGRYQNASPGAQLAARLLSGNWFTDPAQAANQSNAAANYYWNAMGQRPPTRQAPAPSVLGSLATWFDPQQNPINRSLGSLFGAISGR